MPATKMTVYTCLMLVASCFISGVRAVVAYSNHVETETVASQELGSTMMVGSIVYNMNMCFIVHSTSCQLSKSTGSAAPVETPKSSLAPLSSSTKARFVSNSPSDEQPATAVITSTNTRSRQTTMTISRHNMTLMSTRNDNIVTAPTASELFMTSISTSSPMPTSTGASNSVSVVRGVAMGLAPWPLPFSSKHGTLQPLPLDPFLPVSSGLRHSALISSP